MTYIPLKPIPMKDRVSLIFLKYGQIDVKDGAFVLIDKKGVRKHIPVGFIHTGKPQSFVYDIADIYKFDTVIPIAFKVAASHPTQPDRQVRLACRDVFREKKTLKKLIPLIEEVLAAGEIEPPLAPEESVPPAIPLPESIGDAGHRNK